MFQGFKIANCPHKDLAATNLVYFNPAEKFFCNASTDHPIIIQAGNTFPFLTSPHPNVQLGTLALNSNHRNLVQMDVSNDSTSQQDDFEAKIVANQGLTIESCNLRLKMWTPQRISISETEFCNHIIQNYVGQPFINDQTVLVKFQELWFQVAITEMRLKQNEKTNANLVFGLLQSNTQLTLSSSRNNFPKVIKDSRSSIINTSIFNPDFSFAKLQIGGLGAQFNEMFRRAFASRLLPVSEFKALGQQHVRGIVLFGPAGTGKTLIARKISQLLTDVEPKIVNGPEIFSKFVGESEKKIRELFMDAEQDFKKNGDLAKLHVIVFDEIDAIAKARGTKSGDAGSGDLVVNQLLTKMDGVDQLDNILVIGMTNRLDLLDSALLRPGRFEIHLEIPLPDEQGRLQIFQIHTASAKESRYLSDQVSLEQLAHDTANYSGAEIAAVVKSAISFATHRVITARQNQLFNGQQTQKPKMNMTKEDCKTIVLDQDAFDQALTEVKPAFGKDDTKLNHRIAIPRLFSYGPHYDQVVDIVKNRIQLSRESRFIRLHSLLITGNEGTGKTTMAVRLALDAEIPFVKIISPEHYVGFSEQEKVRAIANVFEDAYKSKEAVIILDDLERLIDYIELGPRFSALVVQCLLVFLKRTPAKPHHRLMIIGTSSNGSAQHSIGIKGLFQQVVEVQPMISNTEIRTFLTELSSSHDQVKHLVHRLFPNSKEEIMEEVKLIHPISIQTALMCVDRAASDEELGQQHYLHNIQSFLQQ